jgi:hypothetical protein
MSHDRDIDDILNNGNMAWGGTQNLPHVNSQRGGSNGVRFSPSLNSISTTSTPTPERQAPSQLYNNSNFQRQMPPHFLHNNSGLEQFAPRTALPHQSQNVPADPGRRNFNHYGYAPQHLPTFNTNNWGAPTWVPQYSHPPAYNPYMYQTPYTNPFMPTPVPAPNYQTAPAPPHPQSPVPPNIAVTPTTPRTPALTMPSTTGIPILTRDKGWDAWHLAVTTLITSIDGLNPHIYDEPSTTAIWDPDTIPTYPPVIARRCSELALSKWRTWWSRDGITCFILSSRLSSDVAAQIPPACTDDHRRTARELYQHLRNVVGNTSRPAADRLKAELCLLKAGTDPKPFVYRWRAGYLEITATKHM